MVLSVSQQVVLAPQQPLVPTGLVVRTPAKVETKKTDQGYEYKFTEDSMTFVCKAQEDRSEDRPVGSALYTGKIHEYKTAYGKKIRSILNEAPVLEAYLCGSEDSIGFVMETTEGKGLVVAWQYVRLDGWRYETLVTCERKDQPKMEALLATVWYVEPGSGRLAKSEVGGTGLMCVFGRGFLPKDERTPTEKATKLSLQADIVPVLAAAGVFTKDELDGTTGDSLREGLTKFLSGYVQGATAELSTRKLSDGYDVSGTVTIQAIKVEVHGKVVTDGELNRVVLVIADPRTEESVRIARLMVDSVELAKKP